MRESKLPGMQNTILGWLGFTFAPQNLWLLWRPALYLYASILFVALLAYRTKKREWLLLFIPSFINALSVLLINLAQDFRYMYPSYMVGLISFCLMYWVIGEQTIKLKELPPR